MDLQHSVQKPNSIVSLQVSIIKRELTCALSFLFVLVSSVALIGLVGPFRPRDLFPAAFFPHNSGPGAPRCDYSLGSWVRDDDGHRLRQSYTEGCPFLDPGFRCRKNGRMDEGFRRWMWQPDGCDLPRFNASDLLERSRNGRIVFAGDSLGRNQWESLICMLAQAVSNHSTIYEKNGNPITKHKGFLSMLFSGHNLTIEYYRTPFLVLSGRPPTNSSDRVRMAIMVDRLHWYSRKWIGANVLIFNAGHWWNQEKTVKMGSYFHEGGIVNMTMDVMEAFRRSLQTWKAWVAQNLNLERTHIFFRSYSPVHYRGGTWNEAGRCDTDTAPETDHTKLEKEPPNNAVISDVMKQMENTSGRVQFLNISYLSEFRRDGHPSLHREPGTPVPIIQDCSHWCLPGIPDTWNELLYAYLLSNEFRTK